MAISICGWGSVRAYVRSGGHYTKTWWSDLEAGWHIMRTYLIKGTAIRIDPNSVIEDPCL